VVAKVSCRVRTSCAPSAASVVGSSRAKRACGSRLVGPLQDALGAHERCSGVAHGQSGQVADDGASVPTTPARLLQHEVRPVDVDGSAAHPRTERPGAAPRADDDRVVVEVDFVEHPRRP
jgi:hypothetical protein